MKQPLTFLTAFAFCFSAFSQIDTASFEVKPSSDLQNAGIQLEEGWHKDVVMPALTNQERVESGQYYSRALLENAGREMDGFSIVHLWVAKDGGVRLVGSDSQNERLKGISNDIALGLRFEPATWKGYPLDVQVRARIDFREASRSFSVTIENAPFEAFPFVSLIQPRDLDPTLAIPQPEEEYAIIIELDDDEMQITTIDELTEAPDLSTGTEGKDDGGFFSEGETEISTVITLEEAPAYEESELPDPTQFYHTDERPEPLNLEEVRAKVQLPQVLAATGYTTMVPVRVLVSPTGEYVKHKILVDRHPVAMKVVEDHVSELRFSPAILDGEPIFYWINVEFPMGE